jgi:nucleotide-binding universal stress UspA family protein
MTLSSWRGQDDESIKLLERERAATELDATLTTIASPSVGSGLHRLAEAHAVGLLVVGSTSHSPIGRVLLGDHARAALNGAPWAVAIAPAGYATQARALHAVGVAYNGSIESEAALAAARELAAREGLKISALSVVELPSLEPTPVATDAALRATLEAEQERLDALDGVAGEAVYGPVGPTLAEFGQRVDLLVVGSRSYGPLGRLINGSTSNYLERHARCPLLVLPRSAARNAEDDDAHAHSDAPIAARAESGVEASA